MRPYLTTPRLTLRPFADTDADLDLVVDLDSDPEVMRYLTGGRPMTRTEIRADSFARMLRTYPVGGFWATHLRDTGEFIGWHCLRRFGDAPPRSADLGYRLRKSAWGRGYATEGSPRPHREGLHRAGPRPHHREHHVRERPLPEGHGALRAELRADVLRGVGGAGGGRRARRGGVRTDEGRVVRDRGAGLVREAHGPPGPT
ncbi:GNAT family N-acetyltransferase [Streptomyces xanthochromogenes]|uniref:GNAT family N-acetyltransferase n=1 Tax=Streptomyces xanthochromogenes TaxID=67384 RepID=UPI002F4008EA